MTAVQGGWSRLLPMPAGRIHAMDGDSVYGHTPSAPKLSQQASGLQNEWVNVSL